MGAAAYNRGSRIVARGTDERMVEPSLRASRDAEKDEILRLRTRVNELERDLSRARRCLASERAGRERLRLLLNDSAIAYESSVRILCSALARAGVPGFVKEGEL